METSSNFAKVMMLGKASAGISHGFCPLNCGASSFLRVTTKTEEKKKELVIQVSGLQLGASFVPWGCLAMYVDICVCHSEGWYQEGGLAVVGRG